MSSKNTKMIIIGVMVLLVASVFLLSKKEDKQDPASLQNQEAKTQTTDTQKSASSNNQSGVTDNTPSTPSSAKIETGETANWKTYTNNKYFFSVKYPKTDATGNYPSSINTGEEWFANELEVSGILATVNFGPISSRQGGYIWGINVMSASNTTLDKEIASQGDQWSDREESKQTVTINGNAATIVTVTTTSQPDWISKIVYIEKGGNIFEISNGAIQSTPFDLFYRSFQFTK